MLTGNGDRSWILIYRFPPAYPDRQGQQFQSIGLGGRLLSNISNAIIVRVLAQPYQADDKVFGTGAVASVAEHWAYRTMLNVGNFNDLIETAQGGNLRMLIDDWRYQPGCTSWSAAVTALILAS